MILGEKDFNNILKIGLSQEEAEKQYIALVEQLKAEQ